MKRAGTWKSAKKGTTIRLPSKGPRLPCSVDCKKPVHPSSSHRLVCRKGTMTPGKKAVKSNAQFRARGPQRCRAMQNDRRKQDAHWEAEEHKEVPMESDPPPQQA